ncbi:MAG: lysophospholipid acyltransferase family protein [Moraxellaceae bacterium]|nr:lysophospholipid acyltransferase family protein [Moraxellaceae bacterium]
MKKGGFFRRQVAPLLVYLFYRLLRLTWRVTFDECESFRQALKAREPVVLAHWHGDELALIHLVVRYRIATITSTSHDGELMDEVLRRLGAATARGSSSRGGANAMRGLITHCRRNGNNVSFAVDGPKGPIYKVKPGVFEFSRLMQAPIYSVSVGVSRPWVFGRSWNKAVLPKFFSRVHVRVTEGLPAITRELDPRSPELATQLETLLNDGRQQVNAVVGVERL